MQLHQTVRVGRTALEVPRFGLGTAPISNLHTPVPENQALETVLYAFDNGVNLFDTAPLYGAGLAERRLGMAMADTPRDQYVVSSKVGRLIRPDGKVAFDYSRDGVLRSLEASLERLKLDRIDILLIHDPDNHYKIALNEAFPTLADLRSQGVIHAVGAGMNQWQMELEFARNADFDCFLLAGRYTLLEQTSLAFLALCQSKNISVFLGGVYNSGILATGPKPGAKYNYTAAPSEILDKTRHLKAVCDRYDVPLNAVALQFPLAHPAVTSIVVGAVSSIEVAANIQALQIPIPPELWTDLRAEELLESGTPVPGD